MTRQRKTPQRGKRAPARANARRPPTPTDDKHWEAFVAKLKAVPQGGPEDYAWADNSCPFWEGGRTTRHEALPASALNVGKGRRLLGAGVRENFC